MRARCSGVVSVAILVALGAAACAPHTGQPSDRQPPKEPPSFASLLRTIGERDPDPDDDGLTRAYIARGAAALRFAAERVLANDVDERTIRGSRFVMMSLRSAKDFEFLEQLALSPFSTKRACATREFLGLLGMSAERIHDEETHTTLTHELAPVPPLIARLVRILDEPWPYCEHADPRIEERQTAPPPAMALELLNRMLHWTEPLEFGSNPGYWDTAGADAITKFKTWWAREGPRRALGRRSDSPSP